MKINLVCVEDGIISVGFRKMAACTMAVNPDTRNYFLTLFNSLTPLRILLDKVGEQEELDAETLRQVAEPLANADIVGFSCMSSHADKTKEIIRAIRAINPKIFVVWGGVHAIMEPEDAIPHCDALCTGEGEFAFVDLITAMKEGRDYTGTKNFWFNRGGKIIRNDFLPIAFGEEMDRMPLPLYAEHELIFQKGRGYRPTTTLDYLNYNGLSFNAVWSIGCPYSCSYCGNTVFIENDKDYRKIRHPSVDWLMRQIKDVKAKHPHIQTIVFHDDSFMAIPKRTLKEFAEKWKEQIGLEFCIQGLIPSFVKDDKFAMLVDAGMNRVRMGIQSGSDRILEFYQRPNKPGLIQHAAGIINKYRDYMIPPAYDIILDNPIETRQDVIDTVELLYKLPHPYTLNPNSLKIIPNSVLEEQMRERNIDMDTVRSNFSHYFPSLANILVLLMPVWKPPRALLDYLLRWARPCREEQTLFPRLLQVFRALWLFKRGWNHISYMDFSLIPGRFGYILWKLGIIQFWKKHFSKKYHYTEKTSEPSLEKPMPVEAAADMAAIK